MEWIRGQVIGSGSFSKVCLATPRNSFSQFPQLMSVKSCETCLSDSLHNEREVLMEIGDCPHIIKCLGDDYTVENGESLYNLLLELARCNLSDHVKCSGGRLLEFEAKRYVRSVLKGLLAVHAKGFVHCDLKLDNLLMFDNGDVKIADFGLAKRKGDKSTITEIRGTPLYMAPESVNENEYEAPCDVWALGCVLVEMVSGKPVWNNPSGSLMSLLLKIGGDEQPNIPETLSCKGKDFLSKCFVKEPEKRWTAEMLLNHPFVAGVRDDNSTAKPLIRHFEFFNESSSASEMWSDDETFDSSISSEVSCPRDRIRVLASDQQLNWSNSTSWLTVR